MSSVRVRILFSRTTLEQAEHDIRFEGVRQAPGESHGPSGIPRFDRLLEFVERPVGIGNPRGLGDF